MKRTLLAVALVASLSPFSPGGARADGDGEAGAAAVPDPGFTVHEWGTFTSLAGSDGVLLDGIHADDGALPAFVHGRDRAPAGFRGVSMKMETPVLYVYSDRERTVDVKVRFPGGLLTTWYPEVRSLEPAVAGPDGPPPALKDGLLDWGTVKVLAPGLGLEGLPPVDPADPWAFARGPESNVLRACWRGEKGADEQERFLFYRGLGRFDLPLRLYLVEGRVVLRCADAEEGAEARVVRVEGKRIRTGVLRPVEGTKGAVRAAELAELAETGIEDLVTTLADGLTCRGLTRAEALAMVRTWRKSWLETPGTRVLLPLPRRTTDELLPLEVSPAPRETVRVMVARLDILTPDEEVRAGSIAAGAASAAEAQERLGRFAGPILRRVALTATDPETARRAAELARDLETRR